MSLRRDFDSPSLHDSKQRDIELLEDLSPMRGLSCDEDPGISEKIDHFLSDMARAVIHQSEAIVISKLIETSRIAKNGKEHDADILTENFRRVSGVVRAFTMKSVRKPVSRFFNRSPMAGKS
jgi:hypothetical protein